MINMDKKKISLLLVILIIGGVLYFFVFNKKEYNEYQKDFYEAINKDYKKDKEPSTVFTDAQVKVNKRLDEITKEFINGNDNAKILYNQLLNTNNREIGILKGYIDSINNSNNIKEFIDNAMMVEHDLSVDIFTNIIVMADLKDTNKNIVYFQPITMDFGTDCYYYNDKDYDSITAYLKKYGLAILNAYGMPRPNEVSKNIFEFEKNICSESYKKDDLTDTTKLYNPVTKSELKKIYTNIDVDRYLSIYGIENREYYSVVDVGNLKKFNSLLTDDNLDILKKFTILKILEQYSPYLTMDYITPYMEFYNLLNSDKVVSNTDELALRTIEVAYSKTLGIEYNNKDFSDKKKEIIEALIKELLGYYEQDIKDIKWMSNSTKEAAIKKIKNMKVNVGLGSNMPTYESTYIFKSNNSLLLNIVGINNVENDYMFNQLDISGFYLDIPLTTVNAYYNILDNSINFPAAVGVLFNENDNYYDILGSMGMIIGHEITHALGSKGANFDENGNLKDWWTESDYKEYKKLQDKVRDYYSSFEVFSGLKVDGEVTLDENISDLGGLRAITEIAKQKDAKDEDYKKMYESYAKLWADNYTKEYLALMSIQDIHSPNKVRVNAGLITLDKFKELYEITPETPMYRDNVESIW